MWAKRVALKFMCHCKMFVTPGLTKIKDYSVPLHGVPRFVLLQGLLRFVLLEGLLKFLCYLRAYEGFL